MDTDPAQQTLERKVRTFLGFLMNTEDALRAAGYDLGRAYTEALATYDLSTTHIEHLRPPTSPAAGLRQAEETLFQRFHDGVEHLRRHARDHPLLVDYLHYRSQWQQHLSVAQQVHPKTHPSPHPSPTAAHANETVFGRPWAALQRLHARLSTVTWPDAFTGPFLFFLAGVHHGLVVLQQTSRPAEHTQADGLPPTALTALEQAVEFAFQSEPQALVRSYAFWPEDIAFHCLFMGVAYLQQNPAPQVQRWLDQGSPQENGWRLLFATGVIAANHPGARRLVQPLGNRIPKLAAKHLGAELGEWLEETQRGV